ncbi:MAG: uracil phosphoribosyltransferase [Lentisphaerae bacterium]|nr:uracil phosphoribosyltransferase [Lentisphaerota bacterium]
MHEAVQHPILQHKLSYLRDKQTSNKEFRELISEITMLLAYEALKNVELTPVTIETPIASMTAQRVTHDIVIVPVLRAGVGMLNCLCDLIPTARVGFIGLYRDHDTKLPVEYYVKLPPVANDPIAILVDPMLATGGSTIAAIDLLKQEGFYNIIIVSIVSAPEGLEAVENAHPDVRIYTAAIDDCLNDNKYIVPGLGDAGDRIFGTT